MNQISESEMSLHAVFANLAKWSAKEFRFQFPGIEAALYKQNIRYALVVAPGTPNFAEKAEFFATNIRPVTCPIDLSESAPGGSSLVDESTDYENSLWLAGAPMSVSDLNRILALISPNLPPGLFDFDNAHHRWTFESQEVLTDELKRSVVNATSKVGISEAISFEVRTTASAGASKDFLHLPTSRELNGISTVVRGLVQRDEDDWRDFITNRAKQDIAAEGYQVRRDGFCCLYDASDKSDIRLADLLTIYDQVDLIPDREDGQWLTRHQVSLPDLQELVRLGRIRLVLPHSATHYEPNMIAAVAEVDPTALVLSRSLAARTILHNQTKDPLLYAPLDDRQRAEILSVLARAFPHDWFAGLIASYGRLFRGQGYAFMMQGANATLGFGVGAHLGDIIHSAHDKDIRLELMVAGAAVEWSLGLGASCIPRTFGPGYDETNLSLLIASYLGRTPFTLADPATNRMHSIVDGLLVASDVPPLEVALNFRPSSVSRFRKIAMRMMRETPDVVELKSAVERLNEDVISFERRTERLSKYKLDALAIMVAAKPVADALDAGVGNYASVVAAYVYTVLKDKVSSHWSQELSDAGAIITGLATASSLDAVIVSRSRKSLEASQRAFF